MESTSVTKVFLAVLSLFHIFTLASSDCFKLKYALGNALEDTNCPGPDGEAYPSETIEGLLPQLRQLQKGRSGRTLGPMPLGQAISFSDTEDPMTVREQLLKSHAMGGGHGILDMETHVRRKRDAKRNKGKGKNSSKRKQTTTSTTTATSTSTTATTTMTTTMDEAETKERPSCSQTPARLCKSTFNTTAPMYGVSLTSGDPVTIVQKFPDLLQQVVFETCDSKECDLLHGECVQSYIPYLFLVIPLGPVTLTGQDYVLVESGCTCRPKYAQPGSEPNPTSIIPNFKA